MNSVHLPAGLVADTFAQLRTCGAGRAECVAYWCADLAMPDVLTRLVHPLHQAGPAWYEVDSGWINGFFLELRSRRQTARVQVHTHPGPAGHSATDDQFSLVPAAGFLSLVIPRFATGPVGFSRSVLMRMAADGTWTRTGPEEVFQVE